MEADWSGFDVVSIRRNKFPYFIPCFLRYDCTGVQPERKRLRELQPPGALLLNKFYSTLLTNFTELYSITSPNFRQNWLLC